MGYMGKGDEITLFLYNQTDDKMFNKSNSTLLIINRSYKISEMYVMRIIFYGLMHPFL
jgi:hypothetical protein